MLTWYRRLTAHVAFGGTISDTFRVRRGTRQGAILSPVFANAYLRPLVTTLDDSTLGADLFGHHVPVISYGDALPLLSTNAKNLNTMLQPAGDLAQRWRLEFVHPEPDHTKSHCIVFGGELLAEEPRWSLSVQQLSNRQKSEHLGITLDEGLSAVPHVRHRAARMRASLYGLAPVGMLATGLCPTDKCFLWRTVVSSIRLRGHSSQLRQRHKAHCYPGGDRQDGPGLPRRAHHTALLAAAGIAPAHELIRASWMGPPSSGGRCGPSGSPWPGRPVVVNRTGPNRALSARVPVGGPCRPARRSAPPPSHLHVPHRDRDGAAHAHGRSRAARRAAGPAE